MHVRRTILCLAAIFFWAIHDPDVASGQSSELMEAYPLGHLRACLELARFLPNLFVPHVLRVVGVPVGCVGVPAA